MKNKIIFLNIFLMISLSGIAQESLNTYLKTAANNNPGLKSKFSVYMAAMEKVSQVGALPDPKFTFGYFIEPIETKVGPQKATFSLKQAFPWFGLLDAKGNVATDLANAKYEVFENSKSNLYFEVKTVFYNYYFMEKAIGITKDNMVILQIFKNLSLVKIETGSASIIDELRVELEINDLENQLAFLIDSKNTLQVKFNNLLNQKTNEIIKIPDTLEQKEITFDKTILLDSIYNSNHELKSIDHKLNAFMNLEEVAKKEGMPKFDLGFNYIIVGKNKNSIASNNGDDAFLLPSIGISIPIYRKKYKAMIKEAKYLQESEIAKKHNKKNTLNTIYENTFKEFSDSRRRVILNQKQSVIAKKVLDILITSYSNNSKDFEEVLRIEKQLLKYKLEYQRAIVDENIAIAFIGYLQGK